MTGCRQTRIPPGDDSYNSVVMVGAAAAPVHGLPNWLVDGVQQLLITFQHRAIDCTQLCRDKFTHWFVVVVLLV